MRNTIMLIAVFTALMFNLKAGLAQTADSTATTPSVQAPADPGDVIELQTQEIKVIVEAPQVKLYSTRIKPDLDDVHLEKSFMNEIVGSGEKVVFEDIKSSPDDRIIKTDQLLQKLR